MTKFTAINNSTIFDVCLNTYGSLDYVVKLMSDNNHAGVDALPVAGTVYEFDETKINTNISNGMNQNYNVVQSVAKIKYATAP